MAKTVTTPGTPDNPMGIGFDYVDTYLENAPSDAPFFSPSPTVEAFIGSTASGYNEPMRLLMLQGPRGEGKTTAGIHACGAVAERMAFEGKSHLLPIRIAVVRDTWTNLERTTLVSFQQNADKEGGIELKWLEGKKEAIVDGICHYYFFGLDNRKDCDKLQGFMCGILWLEEVAPAAELATGIPAESLAIGTTSVRQEGVPKRILVTFNPPDEDHWILSVEKVLEEANQRDIIIRKFIIEPGEKSEHFKSLALSAAKFGRRDIADLWDKAAYEFDAYRRRNRLLLDAIGRWDLVARLVEGKVGGVAIGESVVPVFSQDLHVRDVQKDGYIMPIQGIPITRCWDGGLTPSTVWCQFLPNGGCNVLGARTSINMGMAEHIESEVYDFQKKFNIMPRRDMEPPRFDDQGWGRGATGNFDFEDIGDPALWKGNEQTKSEITATYIIENLLNTTVTPGPIAWSARREALLLAFKRNIGGAKGQPGRPFMQLNPREPKKGPKGQMIPNDIGLLIKGLNGRAHYPVDPDTGRIRDSVIAMKNASGIYFQSLDALAYGLAVKAPADAYGKRPRPGRSPDKIPPPPRSWMGL
jgi:hypothetical protein